MTATRHAHQHEAGGPDEIDVTGLPGAGGSFSGDAGDVPFTPAGTIAATDTQAAVEEVATDAASALSTHAGSGHIALSSSTPLVESGAGSAGTGTSASKDDHVHPAAGGSGTLTTVKDEGSNLSTAVVSLDFVGAGVTATGTTAVTVTIPGGSAPTSNILVDIATPIKRTGGSITCNQTSWGELAAETGGPGTGGLDLDMTGLQAGDIVEVCISGLAASAATYLYLDVATIVSGSPVNYFGGVTGASTGDGVMCWTAVTGREDPFGGCVSYVVQSGDLTAGAIKLRPWMRTSSATNRTLFGVAADPLHISARAYRP
jgi:hypothetical protein